jgi:hypothetical protein
MEKQATVLNTANGRIAYRFHARDLHLVMGPAALGLQARDDGAPAGAVGPRAMDQDDMRDGSSHPRQRADHARPT